MQALENINIIRDIADLFGLPPLAVEVGFLLILTALILIVVLVLEAIVNIRKEMIKFSSGANYIANILTMGIKEYKLTAGVFDFNPGEWREDTDELVLRMLQEGKTDDEIKANLEVSEPFIEEVRREAYYDGSLFKKRK